MLTGVFTDSSFWLYGKAFLHTDVVHALFLFYLSPIWSVLLGRLILGESITKLRLLAIALGFSGLAIMLGIENGWPLPRNVGDWLALSAGFAWSCAAVRLRQTGEIGTLEQTLGFYIWVCSSAACSSFHHWAGIVPSPSYPLLAAGPGWSS